MENLVKIQTRATRKRSKRIEMEWMDDNHFQDLGIS